MHRVYRVSLKWCAAIKAGQVNDSHGGSGVQRGLGTSSGFGALKPALTVIITSWPSLCRHGLIYAVMVGCICFVLIVLGGAGASTAPSVHDPA